MVGRVLSLGGEMGVIHMDGCGGDGWAKRWNLEHRGIEGIGYVGFGGY